MKSLFKNLRAIAQPGGKSIPGISVSLCTSLLTISASVGIGITFNPERSLAGACAGVYSSRSGVPTASQSQIGYYNSITKSYVNIATYNSGGNINAIATQPSTGNLFFVNRDTGRTVVYNPNTGSQTTLTGTLPGDTTTIIGATFNPSGKLYVYYSNRTLIEVNPTTGSQTGSTISISGIPGNNDNDPGPRITNGDIAIGTDGVLYAVGDTSSSGGSYTSQLYSIAISGTTATATAVNGNNLITGVSGAAVNGLAIDPATNIFYISTNNGTYQLNFATKVGTQLTSAVGTNDLAACGSPAPDLPTINKSFSPSTVTGIPATSTLTLTLGNTNSVPIYLIQALTDNFQSGLTVSTPSGLSGTCTTIPGNIVTATAGSGLISLNDGFKIPAGGCNVSVNVTANSAGTYTNSIAAGALKTIAGDNANAASSTLVVATTYTISGTLYRDNNSNNTNDSEPALAANVTVTLYNDANANNTIDAGEQVGSPVVTNASGQYNFATVPAGTYKIKVDTADTDIPAGYTLGTANDITATVASANVTGKDFGFDIAAGFCNLGDGTADAAIANYISSEVTNNLTATRSITDTLDDAWRTATGGSSSGTVTPWFGTANTPGSVSNFIYLDPATSSSVNATVELVLVNISGLTNCGGISNTTSSTPVLSTSPALQDTSPRPSSLYNSANQPAFWNQTIVSGNDNRRFAARFTFDKPVKSFGAWFGDLETRTANGTPAILRLLDASGNRIGNDIPIQPTDLSDGTPPDPEAVDQTKCGSSANNIGCGNSSTRWVSFVDNNSTPRVSQVLVIVGDDDFNDNGDTEILSFIGANILPAVASNPNVLLVKRITSINNSTTTRGGDNLAVYKDEASNPYDDNQITVTSPNPPTTPADTDKWVDADNNGEPDLIGGINGGNVRPSDEIEYTIYYLSAGDTTANNVLICDRVPDNATFIPTAFNSFPTKNTTGLPSGDRGIIWQNNGATESLTNASDDDTAEYLSPGVDPTIKYPGIKCDGSNTNGVVVVNLRNLPNAIAPGTPINSYGFIRFRGRVK
ncbi:MAG: hypothetical protein KME54_06375 [Tolypothrix brevis GSE-NOS-MK-07-07A]|jgi:hypothetical protein|nr:hypothetical protein [Tolypothrix brevis GSE-NOS-MK-07-07A]